jgi:Prohead core protein serine protease
MARYLKEHLSFTQAGLEILSEEAADGSGKTLKLKGVCIEGGVRNANERVYPVDEIAKAVDTINDQIRTGHSVLGEVDHPDDLKINLDRVSHMIEKMWMDGPAGMGTLKILPTPMGELVKTMLTNGVKLGVSSRGSGNVDDRTGHVSDFEIVTVDVVAQPSAPNAYPTAIYEGLLNHKGGQQLLDMFKDPAKSGKAQRYVKEEVMRLIRGLKIEGK